MEKSPYPYYPGCTLKTSAREYDISARLVCAEMGIKLEELEDWGCCGAASAHSLNHQSGIALPAHELITAQKFKAPLVTACALCFSRLKFAVHELKNESTRNLIKNIIGQEIQSNYEVIHLIQLIDRHKDNIRVTKPLRSLKVACYYGCLLVRPKEVTNFDDVENPQLMDKVIRVLEAEGVNWRFKTECCGGSHMLTRPDIVVKLSHRLLYQAKQAGADCLAVACPVCHLNLDSNRKTIEAKYKDDVGLPVFYFTQLIGLAMGLSPKQLLLNKHYVNPIPLLQSKGLI